MQPNNKEQKFFIKHKAIGKILEVKMSLISKLICPSQPVCEHSETCYLMEQLLQHEA